MDRIGRYRIVKEIGRGAMGIVYLATDPTIGRPVAIKTLRLRDVDNREQREKLRERLFREARSAGVLSHPNIVTIYDMAEEDGIAYIAMEYVDGPTLDDIMSNGRPLESDKLFSILRQTAIAIDYAHTKGIVHRDIKPANIMLGRDGAPKVTDFGIAKINTAADSYTMTGTLVGTPNYMSPEQVQGVEVTGRADQFSLAVIAYEILTGERPFPGEQLSTVVYKIVAEEPVSPQRLNSTLGPQIDGVLRKGLMKKPENRFRTCAEFAGSLETSCAATRGWRPVARGASLNMSTLGGHAAVPGARGSGKIGASTTSAGSKGGSKILPVAAAILMVAGVFSVLTWNGGGRATDSANVDSRPAPKEQPSRPAPAKPEIDGTARANPPETAAQNETLPVPDKPSAMRAADQERAVGPEQELWISTNPPAARAVLDGSGASCSTPCTLPASPGLHSLSIRMDGYQEERREVHVGTEGQDVPLISLRKSAGVLMITTSPPGATITIDDKVRTEKTPAQITLAPGSYVVMVERNGRRAVDRVEIRNGNTNFVKIPLE